MFMQLCPFKVISDLLYQLIWQVIYLIVQYIYRFLINGLQSFMQVFRKTLSFINQYTIKASVSNYRGDVWKGRDEASEKVYLAEAEKTSNKILLKKVEQEKHEQLDDSQKFESQLREILKRHNITDEALLTQISSLYKASTIN